MALVGLSWFGSFLVLCALSMNLLGSISAEVKTKFDSPQDDSTVTKRSLSFSGDKSHITLNFRHGMRDFIVNSKGFGTLKQTPAFQATLTSGRLGPNYAHGVIKFNDVSLNIGNTYNPSTGKFTAPVDGLYQFSVSYLQQNGYTSHVRLMKDNTVYSDLHANHKNYDQLSKTVLATMKKGQTFWVRLQKSSGYAVYGNSRYTTFAGYLICY